MMLNILGLRMAGQMSLRNTKPLWGKKKKANEVHYTINSNLKNSMLAVTIAVDKCTLQLWSSWWCCWAISAAQTSAGSRR